MSDFGVKETQCTRCGHREVCSLKTEFLKAQKAIDEVYVSRPCEDGKKVGMIRVRDIKHIEPVELRCKHYIPNTGVNIRFDLETILQMNVEKLKARYPHGFDAGHSQHRSSGDI